MSVPNWPGRHDDWRVDPVWMMDDGLGVNCTEYDNSTISSNNNKS
jgi:hypothetical protein